MRAPLHVAFSHCCCVVDCIIFVQWLSYFVRVSVFRAFHCAGFRLFSADSRLRTCLCLSLRSHLLPPWHVALRVESLVSISVDLLIVHRSLHVASCSCDCLVWRVLPVQVGPFPSESGCCSLVQSLQHDQAGQHPARTRAQSAAGRIRQWHHGVRYASWYACSVAQPSAIWFGCVMTFPVELRVIAFCSSCFDWLVVC